MHSPNDEVKRAEVGQIMYLNDFILRNLMFGMLERVGYYDEWLLLGIWLAARNLLLALDCATIDAIPETSSLFVSNI